MCFLLSLGKDPNSWPHSGPSSTWLGPALEGSHPSSVPSTAFPRVLPTAEPQAFISAASSARDPSCFLLIQETRLRALPWARLCVGWQEYSGERDRSSPCPHGAEEVSSLNLPSRVCARTWLCSTRLGGRRLRGARHCMGGVGVGIGVFK